MLEYLIRILVLNLNKKLSSKTLFFAESDPSRNAVELKSLKARTTTLNALD